MTKIFLLFALFFCIVLSAKLSEDKYSSEPRVFMEFKEDRKLPPQWEEKPEENLLSHEIQVLVALKYRNKQKFTEIFDKITDMRSPEYGKYFSREQLRDMIGADDVTINKMKSKKKI